MRKTIKTSRSIYFARYDHKKSTKTLSRMGKIEKYDQKKTC